MIRSDESVSSPCHGRCAAAWTILNHVVGYDLSAALNLTRCMNTVLGVLERALRYHEHAFQPEDFMWGAAQARPGTHGLVHAGSNMVCNSHIV
jgi:hypothetical protein